MTMHKRLRERRTELGVMMKTVCKALDIPMSTYSAWEIDSYPRNPQQYKKLADYLNVSVEYLMFGTDFRKQKEVLLRALDQYVDLKIEEKMQIMRGKN